VRFDVGSIERGALGQMDQQPAEQHRVGSGRDGKKQVGLLRRHGAARIDDHDAGAAFRLVAHDALEQDRMAPGGIGADQHDQVGEIEIRVAAGHRIGPEGAALAGDRRRHAQS
jgi:hypothetical protein